LLWRVWVSHNCLIDWKGETERRREGDAQRRRDRERKVMGTDV
jgi:hypothetical protein